MGRPDDFNVATWPSNDGLRAFALPAARTDRRPDHDVYWGKEMKWLDDKRYTGDRSLKTLAAVQMGLILRQPEGPNGNLIRSPPRLDIRETLRAWR